MYKNVSDMTILLSKKQVMEEYGLGRHLLDKAMARKEISYIKLERRVLFRREHIEEYLARNTVEVQIPQKELKKLKRVLKEKLKKDDNSNSAKK
jgi:predicted DNA-binding transcriptional regulator AlpA